VKGKQLSTKLIAGVVGIGGYLMQGGISFLSAQYGMASDVSVYVAVSLMIVQALTGGHRVSKNMKWCLQMVQLSISAGRGILISFEPCVAEVISSVSPVLIRNALCSRSINEV
jgi:hypothetical protein